MKALTRREKTLVASLGNGNSNKQIAFDLGLSEKSIKVYFHRLFQKVGVSNRTELAVWASKTAPVDAWEKIRGYVMTADFTFDQARELLDIIMSRTAGAGSVRKYRNKPGKLRPPVVPIDGLRAA